MYSNVLHLCDLMCVFVQPSAERGTPSAPFHAPSAVMIGTREWRVHSLVRPNTGVLCSCFVVRVLCILCCVFRVVLFSFVGWKTANVALPLVKFLFVLCFVLHGTSRYVCLLLSSLWVLWWIVARLRTRFSDATAVQLKRDEV